jgi:amino-acid N-acetyltransferase
MQPSSILARRPVIEISPAAVADVPRVIDLLRSLQLPVDDVESHVDSMWLAEDDGRLVGCIALEIYADGGLLRSAAVTAAAQGHGVGRQLTEAVIAAAARLKLPALYLLTTTAEAYFPRFGFEVIQRADVPAGVQASVEFRSACPASAIVMRRVAA